jgi:hypothetical protein
MRFFLALSAILIAACGGSGDGGTTPPPSGPRVYRISLQPPTATLEVGGQVPLTAVAYDSNNVALTLPITFTSSDPAIVSVSNTGVVVGVAVGGPITITAAAGGLTASTRVTVTPPVVARVQITPDTLALQQDGTGTFTVRLEAGDGSQLTGRAVAWVALNPIIATVSQAGLVTPVNIGATQIVATSEGKADTAIAIIAPPPSQVRLVRIVNRLRYSAEILLNGSSRAIVPGNGELDLAVSALQPAQIGWALIRPTDNLVPTGEAASDTFPTIAAPTGTERFEITATLSTGRRYYDPVISTAVTSVVLDLQPRFDAPRCPANWCQALASNDPPRRFGLWRLDPTSVLDIYGRSDAARTGPKLTVPIPAAEVDPITGRWAHTVTATP